MHMADFLSGGVMGDWLKGAASIAEGPRGQLASPKAFEQNERLQPRLDHVRPGVWSLIGNGLSNQTFVEGPEGIIAIDTGECIEEMSAALDALATVTSRPVVAVVYTHFHYVAGTVAITDRFGRDVPIFGHRRIPINRARAANEIGPAYARGLVQQFATSLPLDGPDGVVNVGLGLHYRNPAHRPFTQGHLAPTVELNGGESTTIAGLRVDFDLAPSDADDSLTVWFPDLGVAVQNNVWPLVFNVYAIRGEEYRNPQVMIPGIDRLLALEPEHLVCTHGPSLSGRDEIRRRVTKYRDTIQLMWDQTVRLMNRGHTMDEIAHLVELPPDSESDYYTTEHYGLVEHHVRQIYTGIRGWFDDDPGHLFPLPPVERADRMVEGFGGRDAVRDRVRRAMDDDDLRWALEMSSWLTWSNDSTDDDRRLMADVLRTIAYRTSAANIRNWCLTRARDIDGTESLERLRRHRLREQQILDMSPEASVDLLRVLVDPERAVGLDVHFTIDFGTVVVGVHLRNCVSVRTDGSGARHSVTVTYPTWARLLDGKVTLDDCLANGDVVITGDARIVSHALAVFEVPGLRGRT